jgi:hypothetical protein
VAVQQAEVEVGTLVDAEPVVVVVAVVVERCLLFQVLQSLVVGLVFYVVEVELVCMDTAHCTALLCHCS